MTAPNPQPVADGLLAHPGRHLFRSFLIASLAAVVVLVSVVGLGLHLVNRKNIIHEAELDATRITSALSDDQIEEFMRGAADGDRVIGEREMAALDHRMRTFLRPFHIVKIKVFDTSTEIIYSTDPTIIGKLNKDNPKLDTALSGTPISKFESKESVWDLADEEHFNVGIVETYVPVFAKNGKVIGSFEIYKDVTPDLASGKLALVRTLAMLVIVVLAVFFLLVLIMHRAARTIHRQTDELGAREEKYRRLFSQVDDAIVIFDRSSGRVIDTNPAAARLYGGTELELQQKMIETLGIETARFGESPSAMTDQAVKCEHTRLDGTRLQVEMSAGSFVIRGSEMMFVVVRDTSMKMQSEAEQARNLKEIERFNALAVGRENRMVELKEEVNEMARKAGVAPPYDTETVGV